jgi:hypothetical protein
MNTTTSAAVTINGTTYDILTIDTVETHRAANRPNLANVLEHRGILRDMAIVRQNGSLVYHVYEFANERFSRVTSQFFHVTPAEKAEMIAKLSEVHA